MLRTARELAEDASLKRLAVACHKINVFIEVEVGRKQPLTLPHHMPTALDLQGHNQITWRHSYSEVEELTPELFLQILKLFGADFCFRPELCTLTLKTSSKVCTCSLAVDLRLMRNLDVSALTMVLI